MSAVTNPTPQIATLASRPGIFSGGLASKFKSVTHQQLAELVRSSLLLEEVDKQDFLTKFPEGTDQQTLDALFLGIFSNEKGYLEDELADIELIDPAELQADAELLADKQAYTTRLDALTKIEQSLTITTA